MLALFSGCGGSRAVSPSSPLEMPSPIAVNYVDGAAGVPVNSTFKYTFPSPVLTETVTTKTFFIVPVEVATDVVSAKGPYNEPICNVDRALPAKVSCSSNRECDLETEEPLECNTQYAICITPAIIYEDKTQFPGETLIFTTESCQPVEGTRATVRFTVRLAPSASDPAKTVPVDVCYIESAVLGDEPLACTRSDLVCNKGIEMPVEPIAGSMTAGTYTVGTYTVKDLWPSKDYKIGVCHDGIRVSTVVSVNTKMKRVAIPGMASLMLTEIDLNWDGFPDFFLGGALDTSDIGILYGGKSPGDFDLVRLLGSPNHTDKNGPAWAAVCDMENRGKMDLLIGDSKWDSIVDPTNQVGRVYIISSRDNKLAEEMTVDLDNNPDVTHWDCPTPDPADCYDATFGSAILCIDDPNPASPYYPRTLFIGADGLYNTDPPCTELGMPTGKECGGIFWYRWTAGAWQFEHGGEPMMENVGASYSRVGERLAAVDINNDGIREFFFMSNAHKGIGDPLMGQGEIGMFTAWSGDPIPWRTIHQSSDSLSGPAGESTLWMMQDPNIDIDHDGYNDLIIQSIYTSDAKTFTDWKLRIIIYFGCGDGLNICPKKGAQLDFTEEFGYGGLSFVDMNNDGIKDLAIPTVKAVYIYDGKGLTYDGAALGYRDASGNFTPAEPLKLEFIDTSLTPAKLGIIDAAFTDFNGDGYTDIVGGVNGDIENVEVTDINLTPLLY